MSEKKWAAGEKLYAAQVNKLAAFNSPLSSNDGLYVYDDTNDKFYWIRINQTSIIFYTCVAFGTSIFNEATTLSLGSDYRYISRGFFLNGIYYCWAQKVSNTTWYWLAIDTEALTITEKSVSGISLESQHLSSCYDGSYVYISLDGTDDIRRLTMSSGNLTYVDTINAPETLSAQGLVVLGNNLFAVSSGTATRVVQFNKATGTLVKNWSFNQNALMLHNLNDILYATRRGNGSYDYMLTPFYTE